VCVQLIDIGAVDAVHSDSVIIRTVRHRGLKRFIENDDDRGIRRDMANRIRRIVTA